MKNIFNLVYLLSVISGYSQSQTIPLRTLNIPRGATNYYLKDTYNDLDKYVGTWTYNNPQTNTSLTIKLKKVIKFYNNEDSVYEDYLAGEYRYVENNNEKANTLVNLGQTDPYHNNIMGNLMISDRTQFPVCPECPEDVIRIKLSFDDPERKHISGGMHMWRKTEADGTEKIMIDLYYDGLGLRYWEHPTTPNTLRVPYGKYTLTKIE